MARRFATDIDLLSFSLINAMMNPVSADPSGLGTGQAGRLWFNTTTNKLMVWNGTTAIDLLARANHTGTQTASTISDLASVVKAYRLDEFAAATNPITIVNGTASNHAVTKSQLDAVAASAATGTSIKDPVRAASTATVTVASTGNGASMDGVTIATNDRVLLKNQTTASENGIYVVGSSSLSRATDMDATGEAKPGTMVYVNEGTANGDKVFAITSDVAITIGTTSMTWGQIGAGTSYSGTNPISVSGGTISLNYSTGFAGGLALNGSNLIVDSSVQARKIVGIVPTSTSAPFTVSGAVVTVNHGMSNYAPLVVVRAYTSPASGYTQGQQVEMDNVATDANNVQITFPANPASNNWVVQVIG